MSPPGTAGHARRLHAVVRGRVQGVGFRASTQYEALRLGLAGWVRNLAAGEVELEAEGDHEALEELVRFLWEGPGPAHVDTVAVEWLPAAGLPRPFEVRKTV
jgi:acylphosphatase